MVNRLLTQTYFGLLCLPAGDVERENLRPIVLPVVKLGARAMR